LLFINNIHTNPFQNLALEEFLLKTYKEDIFMLWQNEPTVVVGKHQNTLAEVNLDYLDKNQIKVARRLSGGGAVYHDFGNLNFTYIINGSEGRMVDFGKYTGDIVDALNSLGVPAESNKRHDLILEGKKISGNAEHIFKNRVLHHGTLLFNSDLERLENAILPPAGRYHDKAVKSIRSKVSNILPYFSKPMDISEFRNSLMNHVISKYPDSKMLSIDIEKLDEVKLLSHEKYATWEWIFGYSPLYEVYNKTTKANRQLSVHLVVKKGTITNAEISGDLFENEISDKISNALIGLQHRKEHIYRCLEQKIVLHNIHGYSLQDFINQLF